MRPAEDRGTDGRKDGGAKEEEEEEAKEACAERGCAAERGVSHRVEVPCGR